MINSAIEWTDDTWNPWHGCQKVSPGCKNCYMYRDKKRYGQNGSDIKRSSNSIFRLPFRLKGPLVFTCSWSDFFIESADQWREEAWEIIRKTPNLTYQILTKRPERITRYLPDGWPFKNVWLGVSVESNDFRERMDILRDIEASVRFVSAEPLLGPLDLDLTGFHWVITGGESGHGFRESKEWWFVDIMQRAKLYDCAFFHKQNGGTKKIDGVWGGRELRGKTYHEFPRYKTA